MKTNFHLVPSLFVGLALLLPSWLAITDPGGVGAAGRSSLG
jgi:hypothetical protein